MPGPAIGRYSRVPGPTARIDWTHPLTAGLIRFASVDTQLAQARRLSAPTSKGVMPPGPNYTAGCFSVGGASIAGTLPPVTIATWGKYTVGGTPQAQTVDINAGITGSQATARNWQNRIITVIPFASDQTTVVATDTMSYTLTSGQEYVQVLSIAGDRSTEICLYQRGNTVGVLATSHSSTGTWPSSPITDSDCANTGPIATWMWNRVLSVEEKKAFVSDPLVTLRY